MAGPSEGKIVCRCFAVPEGLIRGAIAERGLRTVDEVTAFTKAGSGCGSCWDELQQILDEVWGRPAPRDVPDESGLSSDQKKARIARLIDGEIRPLLALNGLDVELVDVTGNRVLLRFRGDLAGGQAASYLAVKRDLVRRMSEACGQKMNMVELNVLEQQASQHRT